MKQRNPLKYDDAITFTEEGHKYSYNYEGLEISSEEIVSVSGILKYGWSDPPLDHMAAAIYGGLLKRYFDYLKVPDRRTVIDNLADQNAINLRIQQVQHEVYYETNHRYFLIYLICVHENKKRKPTDERGAGNFDYYDELFLYLFNLGRITKLEDDGFYEFPLNRYSMVADVRNFWTLQTNKGTNMHKAIENYLDFGQIPPSISEVSSDFRRWKAWYESQKFAELDMEIYRIEVRVFSVELAVAGSIDAVFRNADGTYTIFDWKRVSKIDTKYTNDKGFNPNTFEIITGMPYEFADGCKFGERKIDKYFAQLALYSYLFELMDYGKVSRIGIVCLEPRGTASVQLYMVDDMHVLKKQARVLLAKRREQLYVTSN